MKHCIGLAQDLDYIEAILTYLNLRLQLEGLNPAVLRIPWATLSEARRYLRSMTCQEHWGEYEEEVR